MNKTIAQEFIDMQIAYKTYDFKGRKERRGSESLDRKIARENLLIFQSVMDEYSVDFFLLYGTLLGAVREQDFIVHDTDTDLGIFHSDREMFIRAIPKLLENGFEIIRTKEPDDLVTFMRHDEYIDVGIFSESFLGNKRYYVYQNNLIDDYFLLDLSDIHFLGSKFNTPSSVEKFLAKNYGKDWKIPREGEPALPLGQLNYFFRLKRKLLKTNMGSIAKGIYRWIIRKL